MLGRGDAAALVLGSRLFAERWYADLTGRSFGSRAEAVAHWVADPGDHSPHPLFEPVWLYPRGAWRRHAPDPLSHYLAAAARGERPRRSPHPCYPQGELGPLEDWLADHDPAELLPRPRAKDAGGEVVVRLPGHDLDSLVRWVRHLDRTAPDAVVALTDLDPAPQRVLSAVAARMRQVLVADSLLTGGLVEVTVDAGVRPPAWRWLEPLRAVLDRPWVRAVQPVLVDDDHLLASPALTGHPVSALDRLDGTELPERLPGVELTSPDDRGARVLSTATWLPTAVPAYTDERLETGARPPGGVLRWSIDIAAGAAPIGRRWGDWHFARSLANALERLGQWVEIDHPETRGRATRAGTDVVLVVRGLQRVAPQPGAVNLLWVISHPETVTSDELAEFDHAWAAGTAWAERHGVEPLLQCADTTRFHPGVGEADPEGGALFVGNARGGPRPVVTAALAAGVPLEVVGTGWAEHGVHAVRDRVANTDLPELYAGAGVVLNDHHEGMRAEGFVSNRVFDVLAVGGRLLTDEVPGLAEAVGTDVPVWHDADDLTRLARPPYAAWPGPDERRAVAERVVAEHSFDARAATILATARSLLDSRG